MSSRWPAVLWLVRHGESAGNVARDAAHAEGLERIDISGRDVDVPLSPRGEQQATALGHWFAQGHEDGRPEILMASPYRRALQTARLFRDGGGAVADEVICTDERLREKEFGVLDGLTTAGVASVYR
jgi:broad specificity phosphatase PhoE